MEKEKRNKDIGKKWNTQEIMGEKVLRYEDEACETEEIGWQSRDL